MWQGNHRTCCNTSSGAVHNVDIFYISMIPGFEEQSSNSADDFCCSILIKLKWRNFILPFECFGQMLII
jgi:hypothetical protein